MTHSHRPFQLGKKASAKEQPLPEALRLTSLVMRVLCFLAFRCPNLHDHWNSLQSDRAFETVRTRMCSILGNIITTVSCPTPRASQTEPDADMLSQRQVSSPSVMFSSLRPFLCHTSAIHHPFPIVYSLHHSCLPCLPC